MYSFKTVQEQAAARTPKILHSRLHYGSGTAKFRGALVALFGEPQLKSKYVESAYSYWVEAEDASGEKYSLTVSEGLSGPEISGDVSGSHVHEASAELLRLIENTEPVDFEEELIHEEFETKIVYGCKAGTCFYREDR